VDSEDDAPKELLGCRRSGVTQLARAAAAGPQRCRHARAGGQAVVGGGAGQQSPALLLKLVPDALERRKCEAPQVDFPSFTAIGCRERRKAASRRRISRASKRGHRPSMMHNSKLAAAASAAVTVCAAATVARRVR